MKTDPCGKILTGYMPYDKKTAGMRAEKHCSRPFLCICCLLYEFFFKEFKIKFRIEHVF